MAACTLGRGRAAMNAPLNLGGEVRLMEERKQSLAQAIELKLDQREVVGSGGGECPLALPR